MTIIIERTPRGTPTMTASIDIEPRGMQLTVTEDCGGVDAPVSRWLGRESLALLVDGGASVPSYCRASDALVAAKLWEDDGGRTKLGDVVRDEYMRRTADCSICRSRHGLEIIHACE